MLESHFGSLERAWESDKGELSAAGLGPKLISETLSARERIDPDREMERLHSAGVKAFHLRSESYPQRLREVYHPPSVIYVKGDLTADDERGVAVVGTRGPTTYGREMARRLSSDLASSRVTVLSGLARGIDGIAHTAALDSGGRTIAVMGGGLDSIYPAEHTRLAARIAERGAVISEYPLGSRPQAQHFPRRNRVISGLSLGVLVIEGGMKSGALLTVRWALDQDREVFAVPGPVISEKSSGTNWLIQQGAKLVTDCQDVLDELNIAAPGSQIGLDAGAGDSGDDGTETPEQALDLPEDFSANNEIIEERILAALDDAGGQAHVDDLIRAVEMPPSEVTAALTVMELKRTVRQEGGMQFFMGSAVSNDRERKRN